MVNIRADMTKYKLINTLPVRQEWRIPIIESVFKAPDRKAPRFTLCQNVTFVTEKVKAPSVVIEVLRSAPIIPVTG
jgi:hypothetical protein